MTIDGAVSSNTPDLVVRTEGFDRSLQAGPAYKIGRDPAADIAVSDSRVSWQHAVLKVGDGGWLLEDAGSTNGTFMNGQRVRQVPISGDCTLRLGHPDDGPLLACSVAPVKPATGPMGTAMVSTPTPDDRVAWAAQDQQAQDQKAQNQRAQEQRAQEQRAQEQQAQEQRAREQQAQEQRAREQQAQEQQAQEQRAREQQAQEQQAQEQRAQEQRVQEQRAQEQRAQELRAQEARLQELRAQELRVQQQRAAELHRGAPGAGPASSIVRQPSAIMPLPTKVLRIGRAGDNDVVLADLGVSRYHAELRKTGRGYQIVDLGSHNGTFVNGQRTDDAAVTEQDIISIGPATFRLVGDELQQFIDTGDISLESRDLTVQLSSGKVLLDHVTFPLGERCLLGVIGPSGAGKSTLLGALTGIQPATGGNVLYDNRDLYTFYDELRYRIGLVPQQEILHTQLSARRALSYAAELRFPRDTSKAERERRISEVLEELSLTQHAETKTSALSGGQQKRVNVAMELLTKPSLLFLDEPTSGLDPGLDKSVMELMADLAHDGRTVIVVTHSVANLNLCDRLLVLVPGGKVGFFGPPAEALRHFGQPGWAEVFQAFDAEPGRDWAGEYRRSDCCTRYVTSEMEGQAAAARPVETSPAPVARNRFAQLSTLCRRYLAVIASDRVFLAVLAALPLFLGILVRVIPSPQGLRGPGNTDIGTLLLILILSTCFTGAANSVRELVKERVIYNRERAAGLSAGAYLLSKLIILAILSALQAALLVGVGLVGRKMPLTGSFLTHLPLVELLIALGVLAAASMTLGLLISALVSTSERTMPLLVVIVLFQVVLTGGIFGLNGKTGIEQVAWLSPSRWGFAAAASTTNLNVIQFPAAPAAPKTPASSKPAQHKKHSSAKTTADVTGKPVTAKAAKITKPSPTVSASPAGPASSSGSPALTTDPLWKHRAATWLLDVAMMLALGLVFSLIAWWRLIRLGPSRKR